MHEFLEWAKEVWWKQRLTYQIMSIKHSVQFQTPNEPSLTILESDYDVNAAAAASYSREGSDIFGTCSMYEHSSDQKRVWSWPGTFSKHLPYS